MAVLKRMGQFLCLTKKMVITNHFLIRKKQQKEAVVYQPKISDDLIHRLYHLAQARGIPMTHLVNELLETALTKTQGEVNEPPSSYQPSKPKSKKRR